MPNYTYLPFLPHNSGRFFKLQASRDRFHAMPRLRYVLLHYADFCSWHEEEHLISGTPANIPPREMVRR